MRVLLTGPTGLLGSALLTSLLRQGHDILAVSRTRAGVPAERRLATILEVCGWTDPARRLRTYDLQRREGFEGWVRRQGDVEAVVHTAAAVKFRSGLEELERHNVRATVELLDVLDRVSPEAHFHFVSTAYVCGSRTGVCLERERRAGQCFRTAYEESKLRAEECVVDHCERSGRRYSILRPSIIAGDSLTGKAGSFNGVSSLLRALHQLTTRGRSSSFAASPVSIHCDPGATKNVVPVDWVAAAITTLLGKGASGRTYHLTHPDPVTHRRLLELVAGALGARGLQLCSSPAGSAPRTPLQRLLDRKLHHFDPYLWGEPRFDRTELERVLGPDALPPPIDSGYVEKLLRFGAGVKWHSRPLEVAALPPAAVTATADSTRITS